MSCGFDKKATDELFYHEELWDAAYLGYDTKKLIEVSVSELVESALSELKILAEVVNNLLLLVF